jgi:hypothetical protein
MKNKNEFPWGIIIVILIAFIIIGASFIAAIWAHRIKKSPRVLNVELDVLHSKIPDSAVSVYFTTGVSQNGSQDTMVYHCDAYRDNQIRRIIDTLKARGWKNIIIINGSK